jgi:putative membrane protein
LILVDKLILKIILGILGIWLAEKIIPGVKFEGSLQILLMTGAIWGALSFFVGPLVKGIALPLRIITLGLFGFIIDMGLVWLVDIIFPELVIQGLVPLFWTTLLLWGVNNVVSLLFLRK